jgi:hypothetical protein
MITATPVTQENFIFYPNLDLERLRETLFHGAELIRKMLLQRVNQPDFYTVEKDDTEDMYGSLEEVLQEIQVAIAGGYVHFCAQAHYMLPVGDGDVAITLFLADE